MRIDYKGVLYQAGLTKGAIVDVDRAMNAVEGHYRSKNPNHSRGRMLTKILERRETDALLLANNLGVLEAEKVVFNGCELLGIIGFISNEPKSDSNDRRVD